MTMINGSLLLGQKWCIVVYGCAMKMVDSCWIQKEIRGEIKG